MHIGNICGISHSSAKSAPNYKGRRYGTAPNGQASPLKVNVCLGGWITLSVRDDFDLMFISGVAYPFVVFMKGGPLFALSRLMGTVNPSSATIESSILPIPCKTLRLSPLPCYPLPCTPNPIPARPSHTRAEPPFPSAFPNLRTFQPAKMPTMFKLLPNSPIPTLYSLANRPRPQIL
jgi:hypothetical protein